MNRYPLWKYLVVLVALVIGVLYTLPNFYGESPAVQVATAKSTVRVDQSTLSRIDDILQQHNLVPTGTVFEQVDTSITARFRFDNLDDQLRAKDIIEQNLNSDPSNPDYTVALNLMPASPNWLTSIGALPMHLGLDLRGGVHFLLEVDMQGALNSRYETLSTEIRTSLRRENLSVDNVERLNQGIDIELASRADRDQALTLLRREIPELSLAPQAGNGTRITASLSETAIADIQAAAIEQNITTLRNRINELGVSEPIVQRQGADRIVVQLPGVQDVARAKEILGRTASLEIRLVDDSPSAMAALSAGNVPFGVERFYDTDGQALLLRRQILLTGENLERASAGRDSQANEPAVHLELDSKGARIFRDVTRNNINRRMAIVLYEQGVGTVITAPVIRTEIPNGQVQITGSMDARAAADIALLLRSGSLAAPMHIIEERTIGPSLGAENIKQGFDSTLYGFLAISLFIIVYYHLFGLFSTLGLSFNVILLIAVLSMLQATLTLPGIAALALTIGMAIDANVLINERIREEMRNGAPPQQAIQLGFERAWATIFDSNITSLIVGVALLTYGDGPIRGFAVVHCLGILTSMFTSVVGVRALVNLWYGNKRRLTSIAIGQVWKPDNDNK